MMDRLPTPGPLDDLTAFHRLAAARLGGFEHTTVPDEPGLDEPARLGVLARKHPVRRFDDRDPDSQTRERLAPRPPARR